MKVVSVLFMTLALLIVLSTKDDMAFKVINGADDSLDRMSARILNSPLQLPHVIFIVTTLRKVPTHGSVDQCTCKVVYSKAVDIFFSYMGNGGERRY